MIMDYSLELVYKEGNANMVADAQSKKSNHSFNVTTVFSRELYEDFRKLYIELVKKNFIKHQLLLLSTKPKLFKVI